MRPWIAACALIAVSAAAPQALRTVLVCAASIVLEALPYLTASALLVRFAGRNAHRIVAYLGCGCGGGPAARSLPAAVATAALFGMPVALARLAAASAIARCFAREDHAHETGLLAALARLVPSALLAGIIAAFVPASFVAALPAAAAFTAGLLLGAFASPCALGGVALAASLRASSPWAAAGVLCAAGMIDLRALRAPVATGEDRYAHALLALACAIVAAQHGATLVHPRMTIPLACTASICALYALRRCTARSRAAAGIACALLIAVVLGAPAPAYTATETTLADAFAGERTTFTGLAVAERGRSLLVRYAITCCRADAAPVALELNRRVTPGIWMTASGTLVESGGALQLRVARLKLVAPPSDPFIYR